MEEVQQTNQNPETVYHNYSDGLVEVTHAAEAFVISFDLLFQTLKPLRRTDGQHNDSHGPHNHRFIDRVMSYLSKIVMLGTLLCRV